MKVSRFSRTAVLLLSTLLPALLWAQTNCNEGAGPLDPARPAGTSEEAIIQKFSAGESELKRQFSAYGFQQEIKVQTLEGPRVTGEFRRDSNIHFNGGQRMENVTFAPQSSLRGADLTKEDFEDIARSPFILTPENLPQYTVRYAGQQKVDQLQTYVFTVAPKKMLKGKRYFQGRVWVENQGLRIVKSCGKSVPDAIPKAAHRTWLGKKKRAEPANISPTIVTYRELIDGKYWFPTYMRADEVLPFQEGYAVSDIHIREIVKMKDYQRGGYQQTPVLTAK